MNTIIVWILVGYVSGSGVSIASPTPAQFTSERACEIARQATEDVARYSKLRCVKVEVR